MDRGVERGDVVIFVTEGGETSSVIGTDLGALEQYGSSTETKKGSVAPLAKVATPLISRRKLSSPFSSTARSKVPLSDSIRRSGSHRIKGEAFIYREKRIAQRQNRNCGRRTHAGNRQPNSFRIASKPLS